MSTDIKREAVALTIAGSDSGGGAGIQADLKSFAALGVHGASAITAITAQNTLGVRAIHAVPPETIAAQIEAVLDDFDVRAIKIGMVPRAAHIAAVADALASVAIPIVLDPVMIATSGDRLMDPDAVSILRERLFPLAACITPNLPEAAALLDRAPAVTEAEMIAQGRALLALGPGSVLVKGGHADLAEAVDILVSGNGVTRLSAAWVDTPNCHGTGCTLSAAIAAGLALGRPLDEAVAGAKDYLTRALAAGAGRRIGHGSGPLDHWGARSGNGT